MAKTVLCNCKKWWQLWTRKVRPIEIVSFHQERTGKTLYYGASSKWARNASARKRRRLISLSSLRPKIEAEKSNEGGGDVGLSDDAVDNDKEEQGRSDNSDKADRYPDKTFFQCGVGFLIWALWGHTPIHDSACMQLESFGDAKCCGLRCWYLVSAFNNLLESQRCTLHLF